jgi:tetratricopeptide (TPR) repeat protein
MKKLLLLGFIILFIGCPSAPKNSAKIYIERGEYASAREQILIGLKDTPNDYELYVLLAKVEIGLTKWIAASEAFQKSVKIDSAMAVNWLLKDKKNVSVYWQAFYNAALALMRDKKYDEALRNLAYCKVLDPEDVSTYIIEGGIYSELGKPDKANNAYAKALNMDPSNPEAYFLIGKAFFEKKLYDSSLVKFDGAIKYFEAKYKRTGKMIFQNLPEIDQQLAEKINKLWAEKKEKELDELIKVKLGIDAGLNAMKGNIEKFFKTTEGLARSYYFKGMAYYNQNKDELALKSLLRSLELIPEDLDALFYTGELLIKANKYKEALDYFTRSTKLKKDDTYAWFYAAVCHSQLKEYKKAIELYEEQVLVIDPKNINAMTNLAYCYREIGNNKKALEYLMKAEKLQKEQ